MKSRIDKILSSNGLGSRKDIKRLVRSGSFAVNGRICMDSSLLADPNTDIFTLDGAVLPVRTSVYLMLNKPAGVVTSTLDPLHKTVIDVLDEPWSRMNLFPIGRLDYDTEGLLILTNDGPLTHRLTSPKSGTDKTYLVRLRDPLDESMFERYSRVFLEGATFHDGYTCLPARLSGYAPEADPYLCTLTISEGKYHQVKKMFKVVGNEVTYLKRISMGALSLDEALSPGRYRELTADEIDILRGNNERN